MTVNAPASPLRARRIPVGIAVPVLTLGADADMLLGTRILPAAVWLTVFAGIAVAASVVRRRSPGPGTLVLEPSAMAVMWALALFHRAAPAAASSHPGHGGSWLPFALAAALVALCGACLMGSLRVLGRRRSWRAWLGVASAAAMCVAAAVMLL